MKTSTKAFILVAALVVIVAVIAVVRLLRTPPLDEYEGADELTTANTYSDEQYGYEFQLPACWSTQRLSQSQAGQRSSLLVVGPTDLAGQLLNAVQLLHDRLRKGEDATQFLDRKLKMTADVLGKPSKLKVTSRSTLRVAGRDCPQAICELKTPQGRTRIREVVVPCQSGVLDFRLTAKEDEYRQYEPGFDRILASLRFTGSG